MRWNTTSAECWKRSHLAPVLREHRERDRHLWLFVVSRETGRSVNKLDCISSAAVCHSAWCSTHVSTRDFWIPTWCIKQVTDVSVNTAIQNAMHEMSLNTDFYLDFKYFQQVWHLLLLFGTKLLNNDNLTNYQIYFNIIFSSLNTV